MAFLFPRQSNFVVSEWFKNSAESVTFLSSIDTILCGEGVSDGSMEFSLDTQDLKRNLS